jgi:hypothetical protein
MSLAIHSRGSKSVSSVASNDTMAYNIVLKNPHLHYKHVYLVYGSKIAISDCPYTLNIVVNKLLYLNSAKSDAWQLSVPSVHETSCNNVLNWDAFAAILHNPVYKAAEHILL